jgi:RND family efflux transporter MFP subunit
MKNASGLTKRINKTLLLAMACLAATAVAEEQREFDCLIEPHMVVEINSSVQGKIDAITVEKSDLVEQGQTLVELESAVERATVELARARTQLQAEYRTNKVSYQFAKRKLGRFDTLYNDEVVPLHNKDEVETEKNLAALKIMEAKEKKTLAELELKRAVELLDQRTVKSPITGVVVERYKSPGEFVEDEPILQLAQLDPLNVEVIMPASLFGSITPGMTGKVFPEAPRNASYKADVKIVDRIVDASSGTFSVRLELPNPDYKIPGGLKCQVKFGPGLKSTHTNNSRTADKPALVSTR